MKRSRTYDYIVCLRQAEWNTLALQDYSFREVITLDAPGFWERQGLVTQQFNTHVSNFDLHIIKFILLFFLQNQHIF